jgi:hypothetical protein
MSWNKEKNVRKASEKKIKKLENVLKEKEDKIQKIKGKTCQECKKIYSYTPDESLSFSESFDNCFSPID